MAAFEPGNKGGPGGQRPGAGRKPAPVKQALATLLTETPYTVEVVQDGKKVTHELAPNLVTLAVRTIGKAMTDRDEMGNVTGPAIRAAQDVVDRTYGKARQTLKLQGDKRDTGAALTAIHAALTAGRMRDIFAPAPAPPACGPEQETPEPAHEDEPDTTPRRRPTGKPGHKPGAAPATPKRKPARPGPRPPRR